jgi:hypothetical protein
MKQSFWILMLAMLLPMFTIAQNASSRAKQKSVQNTRSRNISATPSSKSTYEPKSKTDTVITRDKAKSGEGKWKGTDSTRVKGNNQGQHKGQNGGERGHEGKTGEHHGKEGEHGKAGEQHGKNGEHHEHEGEEREHHHDANGHEGHEGHEHHNKSGNTPTPKQ